MAHMIRMVSQKSLAGPIRRANLFLDRDWTVRRDSGGSRIQWDTLDASQEMSRVALRS